MSKPKIGDWMWHVHHRDWICEPLTEPLAERIAYVKSAKPANEIETRLRGMTPVGGRIPAALVKAGAACHKAASAYVKAWAAYAKAQADAAPALDRLHAKEHLGCPWNGEQLVFPK